MEGKRQLSGILRDGYENNDVHTRMKGLRMGDLRMEDLGSCQRRSSPTLSLSETQYRTFGPQSHEQ